MKSNRKEQQTSELEKPKRAQRTKTSNERNKMFEWLNSTKSAGSKTTSLRLRFPILMIKYKRKIDDGVGLTELITNLN